MDWRVGDRGGSEGKWLFGRPPVNPGVTEGRLAPRPASPNCVSSQADAVDRRIEPLRYRGERDAERARSLEVLNGMARARIVRADVDYLHAEFRSAVFGFVDDVEFLFDAPGVIQVRSASRTGYYDFSVNRGRVEMIRARFAVASGVPHRKPGLRDPVRASAGHAGSHRTETAGGQPASPSNRRSRAQSNAGPGSVLRPGAMSA